MTNDNLNTADKLFSEAYAKNYTDVVNYIAFKGIDTDTAQDIAQEVFAKALRHLREGKYNVKLSAIPTWLRNIANTVIIDFHRTNQYGKKTVHVTDNREEGEEETNVFFMQFADKSANADSRITRKELRTKINKAFATLNGKERIVANLYFKKEYEYAEIEKKTDFPLGTIKSIINRARIKLQNEIGQCAVA
jgi:RNA polymerase sigma-70 factor (ECF subfamily)